MRLHDGAYRLRRDADGELRFVRPDGGEIGVARMDAIDPTTGGAAHLRWTNEARGLAVGPTTAEALWRGEPCDVNYVVDVYAEASAWVRARAGPPRISSA
jgi:hypothetical protein